MSSQRREFEQFLRRVRRRFVMLRLLERAGLGILLACAVALPLLLIALWREQSALPLASAAILVGASTGLLWGILTRPGELEAAMEADRQLDWADLLASAVSVANRSDDPWAQAVVSIAESRCRQTSPGSIVLHRLGARAWGGIGLATALVVALGVFPTYSTPAPAQNKTELSSGELLLNPNRELPTAQAPHRTARRTAVQPEPEDSMNRRFADDSPNSAENPSNKPGDTSANHSHSQSAANSQSQGAGEGHTDLKNPAELPNAQQGTSATGSEAGGASSGGVGKAAASTHGRDGQSGISSDQSTANSVPPWQSAGWARDVQRAHDAVESGQVPDAYRDVVRGYFERQ